MVFAGRVAADLTRSLVPVPPPRFAAIDRQLFLRPGRSASASLPEAPVLRLRNIMSRYGGLQRSHDRLVTALGEIEKLKHQWRGDIALSNRLIAAGFIIAAALIRTESRGAHFRSDYPLADPAQAKRSHLTLRQVNEIIACYLPAGDGITVPARQAVCS